MADQPLRLMMKRCADLVVAGLLLVLTLPVMLVTALLIRWEDGGPVFYRQKRVGFGFTEFELLKFRSMRVNDLSPEAVGQVELTHDLVTNVGRWLRRYKIDELPQLINVLRGDMSLVGPRPTIAEQVEKYDDAQRRRLLMRPGMTGWAQINGNIRLSWAERIWLDVWYVDHWSLGLDLRILARTLEVVLRGEQLNSDALARALSYANNRSRRC